MDDDRRPPAPDPGAAVQTRGLVKHYPGKSGAIEAVRGVDLQVRAGEVFGFLGPNGAGKSTTVRMLTTLLSITAGTAHVAGIDVARDPDAARRVGSRPPCSRPSRSMASPPVRPGHSVTSPGT